MVPSLFTIPLVQHQGLPLAVQMERGWMVGAGCGVSVGEQQVASREHRPPRMDCV